MKAISEIDIFTELGRIYLQQVPDKEQKLDHGEKSWSDMNIPAKERPIGVGGKKWATYKISFWEGKRLTQPQITVVAAMETKLATTRARNRPTNRKPKRGDDIRYENMVLMFLLRGEPDSIMRLAMRLMKRFSFSTPLEISHCTFQILYRIRPGGVGQQSTPLKERWKDGDKPDRDKWSTKPTIQKSFGTIGTWNRGRFFWAHNTASQTPSPKLARQIMEGNRAIRRHLFHTTKQRYT